MTRQRIVEAKGQLNGEREHLIRVKTTDGLRAKVFYKPTEHENVWKICPSGDRDYGIAAFVTYLTFCNGRVPVVKDWANE